MLVFERVAAHDQGHGAGVAGKVKCRLAGRVAGADQVDVEPVGGVRLAARGAIVDALADQPVETLDGETSPGDAGRQDQAARPDDVAAVEERRVASPDRCRRPTRVTRISAPSRLACCSARLASSSPEMPLGKPR